jgi:hypothetical protein
MTSKSKGLVALAICAAGAVTLAGPRVALPQGDPFQDCICLGVSTGVKYDLDWAHVGCAICTGFGNNTYFIVPGATTKAASHALAVGLTARASQKPLYLRFRQTPSTTPGCGASNCRELLWVGDWD